MNRLNRLANQIMRYSINHARAGHYAKIGRFLINKPRSRLLGYPHHLLIEPTLKCNIRCPLCPTPQSLNPRRFNYEPMSPERFRRIIDHCKDVIFRVHLTTFGEPLLNPDLHLMVGHLTDQGIMSMISTNATLLDGGRAEQLIDAGLDYLIVSFDGFSPESYEAFRVGSDFQKTLANLNVLSRTKLARKSIKPYVDIQWIRNRLNEHEISRGREYFEGLKGIDEFHVKSLSLNEHIMSWEEVRETGRRFLPEKGKIRAQYLGKDRKVKKGGCSDLLSPVVMANGDLSICCMDFKGEYLVGNVLKRPFRELWLSPFYRGMRERANRFELPLCKRCPARFR